MKNVHAFVENDKRFVLAPHFPVTSLRNISTFFNKGQTWYGFSHYGILVGFGFSSPSLLKLSPKIEFVLGGFPIRKKGNFSQTIKRDIRQLHFLLMMLLARVRPHVERDNLAPYVGQPWIYPTFSGSHASSAHIIWPQAKRPHAPNRAQDIDPFRSKLICLGHPPFWYIIAPFYLINCITYSISTI